MSFKQKCLVLIVVALSGCASQKPQMPDEHYPQFAGKWLVVNYCAWKGWMDADTAAKGKRYISSDLSTWTYDVDRLKSRGAALQNDAEKINQGDCRRMAVSIQERAQQIANQNATAEIQYRETQNMLNATKSTNTYCNKIGTQVFCNSF